MNNRHSVLAISIASILAAHTASAGSLTWGTGGNGGDGIWDVNTTSNWWNGSQDTVWPNAGGTDDDAVFGGTGGTVSLGGDLTANDLIFNTTGYVIQNNTLTLNGAAPTITAGTGITATISSALLGSNIVKSGAGTLVLGGSNTIGDVVISQGTLQLNATTALSNTTNVTLGDSNTGANDVPTLSFNGVAANIGNLTVASGIANAKILTGNVWGPPIIKGTTTLNSALTVVKFGSASAHNGIEFGGKITGNGAGAGNDSLIFEYTGTNNSYWQVSHTEANDFVGNVRVKGGTLKTQIFNGNGAPNLFIPDASLLTLDSDFIWNNIDGGSGAVAETMDGLAGSGNMGRNAAAGLTLTIKANNAANDGKRTFSGNLTGMTGALTLSGAGAQEFSGSAINYSVATNLDNGTLRLTKTTAWNSAIVVGSSNTPTLQLNSLLAADSWNFTKQITGGSTDAKIEKVGLGTVVLSPAAGSTFVGNSTGAITVSSGKLYLNSNFSTVPSVSVAAGATFGGSGTAGDITIAAGGTLEGGYNGANFLTADSLAFNGLGTVIGSVGTGVTPIVINNALVASGGANSISISLNGVPSANGTYHLIQFGSYAGGISNFKFASPVRSLSLQLNGSFIDVAVNSSNFPIWTGLGSGNWSTATSTNNWKLSSDGSATDFLALDNPRFDDTASTTAITVGQTNLTPSVMTFDNSSKDYTLTQANSKDITSGSLVKSGTGKLTISGSFSFPGGATFNAGTVSIDNEGALGVGARTFNGGILEYTGATATWLRNTIVNAAGGTISVTDPAAVLTHTGSLSGTGVFTKTGTGALVLSGTNSGSVGVVIGGGTLQLNSATALGSSSSISLGKTGSTNPVLNLNADGMNLGALTVPANVTGAAITMTQNTGTWSHTINGATLNSSLEFDQANATSPRWNQITWGSKLTGNGGGSGHDTLIFNNTSSMQNYITMAADVINDFVGNVHVKAGLIAAQSGSPGSNYFIPDSSLLIVDSGAQWRWNHGGFVETIDGLAGGGTIGNSQNSILTINANNADNAANRVFSGNLGNMGGDLTLGGSGIQEFAGSNITFNNNTNLNSGSLKLTNTNGWASNVTLAATGNPSLVLNAPSDSDVWSLITEIVGGSAASKVEKVGAGTVVLTGSSSYSGGTTVSAGTLFVNGSLAGSFVTVNNGGKLGGTGTVGATTVNVGGTLSPGESIGTLNVGGALSLSGFAVFEINKVGIDLTSDLASVTDLLTLGGTLTVSATGDTLANGDTFNLFDAGSFSGNFSAFNLPTLDPGLSWDTSKLPVDGTLAVIPEPGSWMCLVGGAGMLLGLRRRR